MWSDCYWRAVSSQFHSYWSCVLWWTGCGRTQRSASSAGYRWKTSTLTSLCSSVSAGRKRSSQPCALFVSVFVCFCLHLCLSFSLSLLLSDSLFVCLSDCLSVQEWDQLSAGSSTYRACRRHLVTDRSPSLVHAPGTILLTQSEIHLWHSQRSQNC